MKITINETSEAILATLDGRLDTASAGDFARDIQPLIDQAGKHIILDCAQLQFISSSGLRLFLTLRKASIAAGGTITIRGLQEAVKQVFVITGFLSLFEFE